FTAADADPKDPTKNKPVDGAPKAPAGDDKKDPKDEKPKAKLAPAMVLQQIRAQVGVNDPKGAPERPPAPDTTPRIALDQPFVFLVYDRQTGEILIVGRIVNPRVG